MIRNAEVYLFRHGETDWNREGRFQGMTDIKLNALGRSQARSLQQFFGQYPLDVVFSSDLVRAQETALIGTRDRVPIHFVRGIRETNLGEAEGLTRDEVIKKFGESSWTNWYTLGNENLDYRFPKGESKREHIRRIVSSLRSHLDMYLDQQYHSPRIGISTHGGVLRRFIHHLRPDLTTPVSISNCVVYRAIYRRGGNWIIDIDPAFNAQS